MSTKLTKRDKVLLYVMSIVIIVFAFVWLVLIPQMEKSTELSTQIANLETEKQPMEIAAMGIEGMRTSVENAKKELSESLTMFNPYMQNHEIDKELTNLIVGTYGLNVKSLDMSPTPLAKMVKMYGYGSIEYPEEETEQSEPVGPTIGGDTSESSATESSPSKIETATGETVTDEEGAAEGETEEVPPENIPLLTCETKITVTGQRADFQKMVDDMFTKYPSIRVTEYVITAPDENEFYWYSPIDGVVAVDKEFVMEISLDFYMQRP